MSVTQGPAMDWVSPGGRAAPPALKFPGEVLHVFDGGVWDEDRIAAVRPAPGGIDGIEFVEPAALPGLAQVRGGAVRMPSSRVAR
jgi:hypothetical protein